MFNWFNRIRDRLERLYYDAKTWRRRRRWNRDAAELLKKQPVEEIVPKKTHYCYERYKSHVDPDGYTTRVCRFWHKAYDLPEQNNGYCAYLKVADWQPNVDLLWDQCKMCTINPWVMDEEQYRKTLEAAKEKKEQRDILKGLRDGEDGTKSGV